MEDRNKNNAKIAVLNHLTDAAGSDVYEKELYFEIGSRLTSDYIGMVKAIEELIDEGKIESDSCDGERVFALR